jgi:hypothetical protein
MWPSGIKFGNQQTKTRISIKCSLYGFREEKKSVLAGNRGPLYEGASKIFRTDAVKITKFTIRPIGRHHPRSSFLSHVQPVPSSPLFLERFLEVLFYLSVKQSSAIRRGSTPWYQTGVLSASILFLEIERYHMVPNEGSTVGGV